MALVINGVAVTTPKTFQVDLVDLDSDSSTRNAAGVLMRDRIRQMRKLECEWDGLTQASISTILQNVNAVDFPVTYPDPLSGTDETRTFYVGDRSAPIFDFDKQIWQGLKMDLIEV